jgi:hypothetical protein
MHQQQQQHSVFSGASWNNPIAIQTTEEGTINLGASKAKNILAPIVYVGKRASTAIRVLQLRLEPGLTREAEERGELTSYPDACIISLHGVINKIDYQPVLNTAAACEINQNVFFIETYLVATDLVIERKYHGKSQSYQEVVVQATIVSPCYADPTTVTCNNKETTVLKCTISQEEGIGVREVVNLDGTQKRLRKGKGEPLFSLTGLLIHGTKLDGKREKPQPTPKELPTGRHRRRRSNQMPPEEVNNSALVQLPLAPKKVQEDAVTAEVSKLFRKAGILV